ncbi:hypothetical protein LZ32DRAFT_600506 [Colletotrichum eremochloae]|nr:hypothetical protein LZ32DRAFT_600506 [Colletotrichum eremochloae]
MSIMILMRSIIGDFVYTSHQHSGTDSLTPSGCPNNSPGLSEKCRRPDTPKETRRAVADACPAVKLI